MKRRDFLKQSAAGAAVTVLSRVTPSTFASDGGAKVALVRTGDRVQGIEAAMKLISFPSPKGKNVLIKPNFNTADPAPGSTHNDTLRKLVQEMKARGAAGLAVGDSCGPGSTKKVMEDKGIPAMAEELGFNVINFDELPPEGWVHCNPPGCHYKNGFDVAKPVMDAEFLLWACCLKTHQFGGIYTMALKLAVGVTRKVNGSRFGDLHANDGGILKRIAEIHHGFKPHLVIMDGMEIFVDGGPMTGKRVDANVIVAGTDRIAIDAVGVAILKHHGSNEAIMSKKIFEQEQIARAVELELGVKTPDRIELVTGDAESADYAAKLKEILMQG
ncbi:MAG: DUF362 domain-containing protein [Acidobacteria bacterium]|nr:DUF362 domain-containing protein [Acidobacteriota bacterium]